MNRWTIRTKLILALSVILLLSFISTSTIAFMVAKARFRSGSMDETLPLISNNILSEIQRDLMMPTYVSSLMANDTFLKDWTMAGEADEDQVIRYLAEIKQKYGFFTTFFISARTGRYYYYGGVLKIVRQDDDHDVWYYRFKKQNVDMDLDVDTNEAAEGKLTVFINHRLTDHEGHFLGVTGVGLNMDQISRILSTYRKKYNRMVFMTDADGLVQLHQDPSMALKVHLRDIPGYEDLASSILKRNTEAVTHSVDRDGRPLLLAVRYFPEFDWYLLVEEEERASIRDVRSVMLSNMGVGLLATILVILLVGVTVNHFQLRLERLASLDDLTGLPNRRTFLAGLKREVTRAARYKRPLCLVMIDVDHFKQINDRYGHAIGDNALRGVAETVRGALRDSDMVGRLGGEEFAVMLPETDIGEGVRVAERIRAGIHDAQLDTNAGPIRLTASLGLAARQDGADALEALLKSADEAMYRAKAEGRDCVVTADASPEREPADQG